MYFRPILLGAKNYFEKDRKSTPLETVDLYFGQQSLKTGFLIILPKNLSSNGFDQIQIKNRLWGIL